MLRTVKAVSSLALVVVFSATAHSEPKDVLGWQDARWGMSGKDIAVLRPSVRKLPARQVFFRWYSDYSIPDFKLHNRYYTVFFQMDERTNKLVQILIRLNEMESRVPRDRIFNNLASSLIRQYGAPAGTADERWLKPPIRSIHLSRTWKFPTTTIELSYGWDSQIYASLLTIRYSPTKQDRNDERPQSPSFGRYR